MAVSTRSERRRRTVDLTEFLDDQQQENMINKFTDQLATQSRLYRSVFTIILIIPTPTYIFARHCRSHPKLALLSLLSLWLGVYLLRQSTQRASSLRKLNTALAAVVAVRAWLSTKADRQFSDVVWWFPLLASVSGILLHHWLGEAQAEITVLGKQRYDLRGV